MPEERKPRSDSKIFAIGQEAVAELRDGLLSGWSQRDALAWLAKEHKVKSSGPAITEFWKRHCQPVVSERRRFAAAKAEAFGDRISGRDFTPVIVERFKQTLFEMLDNPAVDMELASELLDKVLKADKQDTDRAKLQAGLKSATEKGLEALFAEVKGNRKAEALVRELQETIKKQ